MREEVFNGIFLGLYKADDSLDIERFLEILEGYSVGPQDRHILRVYWGRLWIVACARGY